MKLNPAVPAAAFLLFTFPLAAFQDTETTPQKPVRERIRDYDSRAYARAGDSAASAGRALAERRERAARTFLRRPGGTRASWRVVLNEAGLPKSVSAARGPVTAPGLGSAEQISRDFLRANRELFQFTEAEIAALRMIRKEEKDGLTFLRFKQTLNDIDVFEGQVRVSVDREGRVVEAGVGDVIPGLSVGTRPSLTPEDAVGAACRMVGLAPPAELRRQEGEFERQVRFVNPDGSHLTDVTVELSIFPLSAESALLAYRVLLEVDSQGWYEIVVDAHSARLLFLQNLYRNAASGRVWKESPIRGSRVMVDFPGAWLNGQATPGVTTGNNADAYLDADGNNQPDSTSDANMKDGRAFNAGLVFDFPAGERSTEQSPKLFQPAAVANLFYLVNLAHDYFYGLGFDEGAGNFQKSNFGRGGKENDALNAQAQDGATNNNSSFASAPDGISPRMHIGLFTYGLSSSSASNYTDADFDGQVVFHEYGHGVTNRIVGAGTDTSCLSGTQSRGLGEGWSDYFAISFFNNPVLGAYVGLDSYAGIRRNSYERYPYTYEDLGNHGFEPHNDGEIWAAALWDIRKQLGQDVTDKLVVSALRLTPCRPSMGDARDAVVAADNAINGGANRAVLWQVFARHGLGSSASGIDGFTHQGTVFTAAYDLPSDLAGGNQSPLVTSRALPRPGMGKDFVYSIDAKDPDGDTLAYQLVRGPDGMTVDAATGKVQWNAAFVGEPVQIAVTDGQGGRVVHGFFVYVETPLTAGSALRIAGRERTTGYATVVVPEKTLYLQVTLRDGSGDSDLWLANPNGVYVAASTRLGTTETLTIPAPAAGVWGVEVDGYRNYGDVTLTAAMPTPRTLAFPVSSFSNLSGDYTSETIYQVTVPAGESLLNVTTSGGTGDVDLYVRKGTVGCSTAVLLTPCRFDSSSLHDGNSESVTISNPSAADYFIDVRGFLAYSGVSLRIAGSLTLDVAPATLSFNFTTGGTAPAGQNLKISERTGASLKWQASSSTQSGGSWLRVNPASGDQTTPLAVSVVPAGLAAGTYQGTVTITATGLSGSPATVPVTLRVQ